MTDRIPSYDLYRGDQLSLPFKYMPLERSEGSYNSSEPHRHNYYEVFVFVEGGGMHDIDFQSYAIVDRSVHLVSPGQVHQVRRSPESYGHILLFTEEFHALEGGQRDSRSTLSYLGLEGPVVALAEGEETLLLATIDNIAREFEGESAYRQEMLRSLLDVVLIHLRRRLEIQRGLEPEGRRAVELTVRLQRLIDEHFTTVHAPSAYAEMLAVTTNHLNTVVRKRLGRSISELIQDRLLLEAKRLLYHTSLTVKEIAYSLNYDDPSYFTRFFRTHVGVTPQAFRDGGRG
jgi:AraC family transcriptional regulator, transcriptional activator of pobA